MALRFRNKKAFDRALIEFGTKIVPEQALLFQKKIALELLARIIERTPVGNPDFWKRPYAPPGYVGGRARANWQISVGSPGSDASQAPEVGTQTGTPMSGVAQAEAIGKLSSAKPFGSIYIWNNVKYITKLESGDHSKRQAPQGMVGISLLEIETFFASQGA